MNRWILAGKFHVRIIGAETIDGFIGEVFRVSPQQHDCLPASEKDIPEEFVSDTFAFRRIWTRTETDQRGAYIACGFRRME